MNLYVFVVLAFEDPLECDGVPTGWLGRSVVSTGRS